MNIIDALKKIQGGDAGMRRVGFHRSELIVYCAERDLLFLFDTAGIESKEYRWINTYSYLFTGDEILSNDWEVVPVDKESVQQWKRVLLKSDFC